MHKVLVVAYLLVAVQFLTVAKEPVGEIVSVQGEAYLAHVLKPKKPAKVGDKIFAKDKIKTGGDGEVVIDLFGDSTLTVAPSSYLKIPKKKAKSGSTELSLFGGKVGFEVKPLGGAQTFTVRSPSAVAGVRGTHGQMSFDLNSGVTGAQSLEHTDGRQDESVLYTVLPERASVLDQVIAASREAESVGENYEVAESVLVVNEGQASFFMADGASALLEMGADQELMSFSKNVAKDLRGKAAVGRAQGRFRGMDENKIAYLEELEQRLRNIVQSAADSRLPEPPDSPL